MSELQEHVLVKVALIYSSSSSGRTKAIWRSTSEVDLDRYFKLFDPFLITIKKESDDDDVYSSKW
jgi:hypothetical protein